MGRPNYARAVTDLFREIGVMVRCRQCGVLAFEDVTANDRNKLRCGKCGGRVDTNPSVVDMLADLDREPT